MHSDVSSKPSAALVASFAVLSVVAMSSAVYFAGTGKLPLAMTGAGLFVLLGGITFELARRRSV